MYSNNPQWETTGSEQIKEKTTHGVVGDVKYTDICVAHITVTKTGDLGSDDMQQKNYNLMDDILEEDVLMFFTEITKLSLGFDIFHVSSLVQKTRTVM